METIGRTASQAHPIDPNIAHKVSRPRRESAPSRSNNHAAPVDAKYLTYRPGSSGLSKPKGPKYLYGRM